MTHRYSGPSILWVCAWLSADCRLIVTGFDAVVLLLHEIGSRSSSTNSPSISAEIFAPLAITSFISGHVASQGRPLANMPKVFHTDATNRFDPPRAVCSNMLHSVADR
jgi:hypothetical protein